MGMFKDMKGAFDVIRSDELKELKKKADAQPKTSMMDGVKMANQAMDSAQEMQAAMNQSGPHGQPDGEHGHDGRRPDGHRHGHRRSRRPAPR